MMAASDSPDMDYTRERVPEYENIRRDMHKAIEARDTKSVQECLDAAPELKFWLDPTLDESALYKAVLQKAFYIYGLLLSRGCRLKDPDETQKCNRGLSQIEKAEIRRQRFFATEYKDSFIHYLKSKSVSLTRCEDFDAKLDRMYKKLASTELISTILKVAASAPHLDIRFDYESEGVQRITGCSGKGILGLATPQQEKVYVGGEATEGEVHGTFIHEMCHLALYMVYKNSGKPYFCDDWDREYQYKAILDGIKKKQKGLHLVIQRAFIQDEEQELIVRVPHILAQYCNTGEGRGILETEVPELLSCFENIVVPDMQRYVQDEGPGKDSQKISEQNARLQKAFETAKFNVSFDAPLSRHHFGKIPLLVLAGSDLRLLEIMVHGAVQRTGKSYVFFDVNQWDHTLRIALLDYKCAYVLVTVSADKDMREVLEVLSELSNVTGTNILLLVEDQGKDDLLKRVQQNTFFVDKYDVLYVPEASFEHVTRDCKDRVFKKSCIKLQGRSLTLLSRAMSIDDFLRCMDTATFLRLCESKIFEVGPSLHVLAKDVNRYFVERVCERAAEVVLKQNKFNIEADAFALLGCVDRPPLQLLPKGCEVGELDRMEGYRTFVLIKHRTDYNILTNDGRYKGKAVHLLEYLPEDGAFLWRKSNGSLSHLPMAGHVVEEPLSLINNHEKVVVVCGAPGIGKSVLASWLPKQIKDQNEDRWVLFVDLPRSTRSINVNSATDDLEALAELCKVNASGLELALFRTCVKTGSPFQIVVIFDAFDEVSEASRSYILTLVNSLTATEVYKILIFTRTVFKTTIQDSLYSLAYELVPFSQANQEEFLGNYRGEDHSAQAGSQASLQYTGKLYSFLRSKASTILENPLLLRMMADIESGETIDNQYLSSLQEELVSSQCVYAVDIYRMFVEYKYLIHRKEKKNEDTSIAAVQDDADAMKQLAYKKHGILALRVVFGERLLECLLDEDEKRQLKPGSDLMREVSENHLRQGYVNGVNNGVPEFVHKMFAEYFAADFLVRKVRATRSPDLIEYLVFLYKLRNIFGETFRFIDGLASSSSRLHAAIMNGDISYLQQRQVTREDMETLDIFERTPLHLAASYADKRMLEILPIDDELIKEDILGSTPFMYACNVTLNYNNVNIEFAVRLDAFCARCNRESTKWAESALAREYGINAKEDFIVTLMSIGVKNDLPGIVKVFVRYFSPKRLTRIFRSLHQREFVQSILRLSWFFVNRRWLWDLDSLGSSHRDATIAYAKSMEVCKLLHPYCDVGIFDSDFTGDTMLHRSAEKGYIEAVEFHLQYSSAYVRNYFGETPLHSAARTGQADVVRKLLPFYSSLRIRDGFSSTPMLSSVSNRSVNLDVVKLLLLRAPLDEVDKHGRSCFYFACIREDLDIVKLLQPHLPCNILRYYSDVSFLHASLLFGLHCETIMCILPHYPYYNTCEFLSQTAAHICGVRNSWKTLRAMFPYLSVHSTDEKVVQSFAEIIFPEKLESVEESTLGLKLFLLHSVASIADPYGPTARHIFMRRYVTGRIPLAKLLIPHCYTDSNDVVCSTPADIGLGHMNDFEVLLQRLTRETGEEEEGSIPLRDLYGVSLASGRLRRWIPQVRTAMNKGYLLTR